MRKLFLQHPRNGGSILATKDRGSKALQNINSVWCFGIKAKLQLSFSAVAFLTAFAVVVSFAGFNAIEGSLQRVVKSEMPAMTNAMRLSVISSNISSEAARFISAKTDDDRLKTMALMKRLRSDLRGSIAVTKDEIGNSLALTNIIGLAQFLDANLEDLEDAILKRTRVREEIDEKIDRLHLVHAQITDDLFHISDPLQRLELSSRVHLLVGLISEGAMVRDSSAFQDIQERLKTASSSLVTYFFKIDNENGAALSGLDKIRIDIRELNRNSQGIDSIFALRARELFLTTHIDAAIDENVSIQKQLDSSVMTLVRDAEFNEQGDAEALIQSIQISKVILLLIVTLSLIAAGSIGFFYVQRHLVNRLTGMGTAMRKLAAGDIDTSILSAGETDEIGEMARSLEFFRAGEMERRSLLDRERSEQKLQRDRTANMEHMISDFRAIITTVISSLAENVLRMEGTATTLSMISQDADQQARAVSRSSETTSTNVQSVSGATTQLGISIHEINEKTSRARAVTRIATDTTRSTDELVSKLSKNAAQVGDVTELISGIAARTNLLALNASIEAARAGEFGRGFSVVASEVKELATQTANATQEISTKIEAMQDLSRQAVAAIQSIGSVMDDINSFTSAIAVAVEQQAASTEMIAENVQEAAVGAADVSFKMSVVTQAIDDTNRSAAVVQDISHVFSMQARTLESAVDDFLKRVTAA